jgi:hypothetical protein
MRSISDDLAVQCKAVKCAREIQEVRYFLICSFVVFHTGFAFSTLADYCVSVVETSKM